MANPRTVGGATQDSRVGYVIRQMEPPNLETPLDLVDSFITPSDLFYVRSHLPVPVIEREAYRLTIDGAVDSPLSLSYDDLVRMGSETRVATLECAGNGRVFLIPPAPGAQWELGAVGNANWTGVPLSTLLERAGLASDAVEIVFEGADRGKPKEEPVPPGEISYARGIPRAKALQPDVLIAYQMNGEDLPRDHGFPVRAIVPGHFGMASVKWLTRIHAVRQPFLGYWQTIDYGYWYDTDGMAARGSLGEMLVKSEILRPRVHEKVPPNQVYPIFGYAWAGESDVVSVEVSTDGGQTWAVATFIDEIKRHAWRRWRFDWHTPQNPGEHVLLSRASDSSSNVQPDKHDPHFGSYVINYPLPILVFVEQAGG
ncbi:MAG: sulfite oxidase-like oxidoreductase [Devosia sp.]|uniref:sulfite oxidase n=1 Tax=Devosia sp. TaxID=1871048 RepID=UPI00262E984B|nr:sulfite oxidase [Devosia sp.]MDB5542361.1 sulfite oxidase-like oxidoreductase [Devosia sp.]